MKQPSNASRVAGLGFEFAAAVAGFCFFGYWIGGFYDRAEIGLVIGAVLGLIGGMYNLLRATWRDSRKPMARDGKSDSSAED